MASRRDELNAYTFAKRRLVAQFVQPNSTGSEEGAPRPLRAVVPGAIIGVVILAGFGAWGMFKPVAPKGWDSGENVIIASKSTTRYVVLTTDNRKQLHPVLNMASAKLLLDGDSGKVVNVSEKELDNGRIPRGATIGIPYAPDRLPDSKAAGSAKRWAVCERPGEGGRAIQKAAFVLAGTKEEKRTEGANKLRGGELMYVEGPAPDRTRYVVDATGKAYPVENDELLLRLLVDQNGEPQRVSASWLETLHKGDEITFPEFTGVPGEAAGAPGELTPEENTVGMVLSADSGTKKQMYVVLPGRVAPVTDFTAKLLLSRKDLVELGQDGSAKPVSPGAIQPGQAFGSEYDWPVNAPETVNSPSTAPGSRNTVCNVLRKVDKDGSTTLSTWAGTEFPATLPAGSSSAYVTPGSGQLFRQFTGSRTDTGFVFLVTDTGLRYAMQSNGDSGADDSGIGASGTARQKAEREQQEDQRAQIRLGYKEVTPAPIPAAWSSFLPTGPRLSTGSARQPQGS
ncbi:MULTISPECIES: type VII secretion protein EccB [unclassified Streptomyces]|uniref:type VII secretion protein EccB n=1 Tax=unclassified Streptomyces TaxID=2593676 RepID=UPI0038234FC5